MDSTSAATFMGSNAFRYGLALLSCAVTIGISLVLDHYSIKLNLVMLVVFALLVPAWYGGRGPGLLVGIIFETVTILSNPIPPPNTSLGQYIFGHVSVMSFYVLLVLLVSSRRNAEKRSTERREWLRVTLNSIGEAVIATDVNGVITFMNPAAEALTGWRTEEALDRHLGAVFNIINPITRQALENPVAKVLRERTAVGLANHAVLISRHGNEVPIDDSGAPIRGVGGEIIGVILVFRDVSEKKRAENSLRRQAMLIEQSYESIFVWDVDRGIIEWNSGSELLYGYSREEALGRMGFDLLKSKFPVSFDEFLSELKRSGWWTGEVRQRTKSGTEVIAESRCQLIELDGRWIVLQTNRDITERKQADAAMLESEERYRNLFENNPVPMWVYDLGTLEFLAVNDAAVFHYGYSEKEFLSMTIKDIRPPENIPALLEDVAKRSSKYEGRKVWKHQKRDGTIIDVEISSHDFVFDGKSSRLVLANDVTERKRAEEALSTLNETLEHRVAKRTAQLEAANKELESFSYSVSHDLRAPLRAIDGFARIFVEDYTGGLDDEGRRVLDVIRTNAQNMGILIDDLLAFSRLGRKEIESTKIDMKELAESVSRELYPDAGSNPFNIDDLPPASGDIALMRQVLANLFSNALKYSGKNFGADITVGSYSENGENVYFVRDQGVGFDMRYSNKLFQVFQRLHSPEEFEGTGVGLAIVHRVIQRHGGRVWAEGVVDEGATFYFSLPQK